MTLKMVGEKDTKKIIAIGIIGMFLLTSFSVLSAKVETEPLNGNILYINDDRTVDYTAGSDLKGMESNFGKNNVNQEETAKIIQDIQQIKNKYILVNKTIGEKQVLYYEHLIDDIQIKNNFILINKDKNTGELIKYDKSWNESIDSQIQNFNTDFSSVSIDNYYWNQKVIFLDEKNTTSFYQFNGIVEYPVLCLEVRFEDGRTVLYDNSGEEIGSGIPAPSEAFLMTGPYTENDSGKGNWNSMCSNAEIFYSRWSDSYISVFNPYPSTLISPRVSDPNFELFYEVAHGDSWGFQAHTDEGHWEEYCSSNTNGANVKEDMADRPPMKFAFIGSCEGMTHTGPGTFSYEFRKGQMVGTATVGYTGMASSPGWSVAIPWQNYMFTLMYQGYTIKYAFDEACTEYPTIADAVKFVGDETLTMSVKVKQITTIEDLNSIRNGPGFYVLMNDLDFLCDNSYDNASANKTGFITGDGWLPIGDNNGFTGTFDGNNKTISNLFIDRCGSNYVGLFRSIASGTEIFNLGLVDVNVNGSTGVGGLAGSNMGCISNSYATGTVIGDSGWVGGLVGINSGYVFNCYFTGSVTAGNVYAGGLAGSNYNSISDSYATGRVTGTKDVGGFVGFNKGSISNCYATGSVTGDWYVGGLAGSNYNSISDSYATGTVIVGDSGCWVGGLVGYNYYGSISNCYATGSVTGDWYVGGLVGSNAGEGSVSSSFYDRETSGRSDTGKGTPKYTHEMQSFDTFNNAGWDIGEKGSIYYKTWYIDDGNDYPMLGWEADWWINTCPVSNNEKPVNTSTNVAIDIREWSVYICDADGHNTRGTIECSSGDIMSWTDLGNGTRSLNFSSNLSYNTRNTVWLNFTDGYCDVNETYWFETKPCPYIYTIEDLDNIHNYLSGNYILMNDLDFKDDDSYDNASVNKTGYITGNGWNPIGGSWPYFSGTFNGNNKTISNLFINRSSTEDVGLFGIINLGAEISNLRVIGVDVSGKRHVGGLVGQNHGSTTNSYATGIVTGNEWVGGLVGINSGYVFNCYFTGSVTAGNVYAGGLAGSNYNSISDSYSSGDVKGNTAGGLVGLNFYGSISNCYATGRVTGGCNVGGLVGIKGNIYVDTNNFWDIETSGQTSSDMGTGKTTSEMQSFNTFSDAGWSIAKIEDYVNEIWFINHKKDYPRLAMEYFVVNGSFTFDLIEGFNLITIPVENNFMASTLAENITGCEMISRWDSILQTYKSYIVGGPPSFDFPIEDGIGYDILVENDTTFTVSGNLLTDVSTTLVQGYNLLGWYKSESTTASAIKKEYPKCFKIIGFDPITQTEKVYESLADQDFSIGQGDGYFVVIDNIAPETKVIFNGKLGINGWYISNVAITLTATDTGSGINHNYYQVDSGSWNTYTTPFVVSTEGVHTLKYYSVDNAGNIESVKGPFLSKIDKTPPTITLAKQRISINQIKFTAEVSDWTSVKSSQSATPIIFIRLKEIIKKHSILATIIKPVDQTNPTSPVNPTNPANPTNTENPVSPILDIEQTSSSPSIQQPTTTTTNDDQRTIQSILQSSPSSSTSQPISIQQSATSITKTPSSSASSPTTSPISTDLSTSPTTSTPTSTTGPTSSSSLSTSSSITSVSRPNLID